MQFTIDRAILAGYQRRFAAAQAAYSNSLTRLAEAKDSRDGILDNIKRRGESRDGNLQGRALECLLPVFSLERARLMQPRDDEVERLEARNAEIARLAADVDADEAHMAAINDVFSNVVTYAKARP